MDALYFKTNNKNALFKELGIPENSTGIYESPDSWVMVWLGKVPETTEKRKDGEGIEYEVVTKWKEGELFNIYLNGQDNMDFFTQRLINATQLSEPETPNNILL